MLMFSLYGLGKHVGNRLTGLLAAITTPILPAFLSLQERSTIDYSSVSMFVVSFYFLFKTNHLQNRKYSIYLGLSILINMLLKWPFAIPAVPFVYYIFESLFNKSNTGNSKKCVIKNLLTIIGISSISLCWYIPNTGSIINGLSYFWNPNGLPQLAWLFPHGLSLNNILLYIFSYPNGPSGIGIPVLIFFLTSITIAITQNNPKIKYLISSVVITYLTLTILHDKSEYYISYTYPLLMIITISTLTKINSKHIKTVLCCVFFGSICFNFFLAQFNFIKYKQLYIDVANTRLYLLPNYFTKFPSLNWSTYVLFENKYIDGHTCSSGILVFPDDRYINFSNIGYYLLVRKIYTQSVPAFIYYNPTQENSFDFTIINKYSCIIVKSGNPGIISNKKVNTYVYNFLISKPEYTYKNINNPDDSITTIFIKKHY